MGAEIRLWVTTAFVITGTHGLEEPPAGQGLVTMEEQTIKETALPMNGGGRVRINNVFGR